MKGKGGGNAEIEVVPFGEVVVFNEMIKEGPNKCQIMTSNSQTCQTNLKSIMEHTK